MLFAPKYYKDFKCIADRCTHSCCIGWEIDIDSTTQKKYADLSGGYAENIKSSITGETEVHFKLCENDRCPHLDVNGLCKIITEYGQDYLCDICREHPRFYLDTPYGKEVGLGMSCEEAARIILNSDGYDDFIEIGEIEGTPDMCDFDAIEHRKWIFSTLAGDLTYQQKLDAISSRYGVFLSVHSDTEWSEILDELEYLDNAHADLFSGFQSNPQTEKPLQAFLIRAFAYFVFRHCSEAKNESEFAASLGFAMFCASLLASISNTENVFENARIISEELEYSEDNTEYLKMEFLF